MRKFYGFIRGFFYLPFKLFYPTKVLNRQNMPQSERLVSVSNHYTWKDIPVLAVNVPGFRRFIAKKEIGKNKLIHKLAEMIGVIFIDRDKPDMHAIRESVSTLKSGDGISIFPEGTRNKEGDGLHQIKGGVTLLAIKGNAPIVPMIIWRKERIFRRNYIFIGEPFNLDQFQGKLLDGETIAQAGEIVADHMRQAQADMEILIKEKRWIAQKREHKAFLKNQRRMNSEAKKSYQEYKRNKKRDRVESL